MEEVALKLLAQVTLVAIIAYVVVKVSTPAYVVPSCGPTNSGRGDPGRRAKGDVWNNTPVSGPRVMTGLAFGTQPLM